MDAGHILVTALTSAAVAWLVWVEIHSRRNAAVQSAQEPDEPSEPKTNEGRPIIAAAAKLAKCKDKARARIR